jgi:hypothetical protein
MMRGYRATATVYGALTLLAGSCSVDEGYDFDGEGAGSGNEGGERNSESGGAPSAGEPGSAAEAGESAGGSAGASFDPCAQNPCKNGGVCRTAASGFECSCPANFAPPTCESTNSGGSGGGEPASGNTGGESDVNLGNAGHSGAGGSAEAGGSAGANGGTAGANASGGDAGGEAPLKDDGAACDAGTECSSGLCGSEGVCCDAECDGQCESCLSPANRGTCVAVTTPKEPCDGTGTPCGGVCNGTARTSCVYPSTATVCAAPSCTAAGARGESKCSGAGECVAPNPMTCVYGCDGTSCALCRQKHSSNLLVNPGFDGGLTSWNGGTFANYSSNDADDCASSGSFALDYLQEMSQCVSDVTPGTRYYLAFRFKGWDNSDTHAAYCLVNFKSGADCEGSNVSTVDVSAMSNGAWVTAVANSSVAPAGAVSMVFACSGSVGHGFYDQLYLGTSSTARF